MQKISWIQRIFMSWNKLEEYFNVDTSSNENNNRFIEEMKKSNQDLRKDKEIHLIRINELESQVKEIKINLQSKSEQITSKDSRILQLTSDISKIETELKEKISQKQEVQEQINKKLETVSKIEKTFFAKSGNKGKGQLGEMQVKTILEKSGLPLDLWTKNLTVGNNVVEFAIKSAEDGKWIPVDSKVLDAELNENGEVVIDKNYASKVRHQAKEISKYLSKKNTAGYGILVLQSDSIYITLYDLFPQIFQEILKEFKIHIASPSSFIQSAWSISQIVDIYDKVQNDVNIYKEMISALDTVASFANSLQKVRQNFNIAMDNHYPAISNKHMKLSTKLEKIGKIKAIKDNRGESNGEK